MRLVPIFGAGYVEKLLSDHHDSIATAARLVELAHRERLSGPEAEEAAARVRGILPHLRDCDGLSIMVELLPDEQIEAVLDTRARSLEAGLGLLEWAAELRARSGAAGMNP